MQSVSVRIWTRVAVSNSYDGNHYTTGTSTKLDDKNATSNVEQILEAISHKTAAVWPPTSCL